MTLKYCRVRDTRLSSVEDPHIFVGTFDFSISFKCSACTSLAFSATERPFFNFVCLLKMISIFPVLVTAISRTDARRLGTRPAATVLVCKDVDALRSPASKTPSLHIRQSPWITSKSSFLFGYLPIYFTITTIVPHASRCYLFSSLRLWTFWTFSLRLEVTGRIQSFFYLVFIFRFILILRLRATLSFSIRV